MKQRTLIYVFSLLLLLPLVYVFGTGIMEARNLISAQSMALDHDWLIPHLFTEIRLNKPPLPVWLTVPVFLLDPEPSMFALHLPVILVTALLGVFCYDLCRTLFDDDKTAFCSGLVVSSMLLTLKLGTTNSWDIYSVVFMTGALVGLVKQGRGPLIAGMLFMAASILSKGPVQLYTMLLPFLACLLIFRRGIPWKRLAVILTGGCLIGSLWYLYVYFAVPHVAASVAQGEVKAWSTMHTASFFFYLSFPGFAGAWALVSLSGLFNRWLNKSDESRADMKFTLCWFLLSLLLLSLVPEKKERYLMPAMVPLALLSAQVLRHWVSGLAAGTLSRVEKGIITVHLGLGTLAAAGICLFIAFSHRDYALYCAVFALLCLLVGVFGLKFPRYIVSVSCFMILLVCLAACRMGSTRPVMQKTPPSCTLEELRAMPELKGIPCYSFDAFDPTDEWEIGRDTTKITSLADVPEPHFLLLDTDTTPPSVISEGGLEVEKRLLIQTSRGRYMQLFVVDKK